VAHGTSYTVHGNWHLHERTNARTHTQHTHTHTHTHTHARTHTHAHAHTVQYVRDDLDAGGQVFVGVGSDEYVDGLVGLASVDLQKRTDERTDERTDGQTDKRTTNERKRPDGREDRKGWMERNAWAFEATTQTENHTITSARAHQHINTHHCQCAQTTLHLQTWKPNMRAYLGTNIGSSIPP
jgi:hypothetical protein